MLGERTVACGGEAQGLSAVLYTNECAANLSQLGGVSEALDLIGADV